MTTIKDKLEQAGHRPEQGYQPRASLSVSEKGQRYKLSLADRRLSAVYAVDGHIITSGTKCDKLILVETDAAAPAWTEIFVELKGSDVAHAIEQLEATIAHPLFKHASVKRVNARIVARRIPASSGNSVLVKAKKRFLSKYHCDLRALNSGAPDRL